MPMPARDSSADAGRGPVGVRAGHRQRRGSASRTTVPTARSRTPAASGAAVGVRAAARAARPLPTDALSCPGVPSAMTRPRSMTAIPSASWSASSRYWVQSRIVVPPATSARQISQTWPRDRGSRPVVGSSRNISRGVTTMLAAMSSRRRIPPEKCLTSRPDASAIPNASSSSSARVRAPARARPEQPAEQDQVLPAGELLVDRRQLAGEAHLARGRRRPRCGCRGPARGRCRRRAGSGWPASGSSSSCPPRWGRARRRWPPRARRGRRRRRRGSPRTTSPARWPRSRVVHLRWSWDSSAPVPRKRSLSLLTKSCARN